MAFPLLAAGYWSARFALADHFYRQDTLPGAARAARLDSGNARYQSWLARLQEHEGEDATPALERALALNPRDSGARIRLGFLAEQRRDFARAESDLLTAARLDRQFDPRAALVNYYFRRGDAAHFWHWLREALAVSYGDLAPLFDLAWRMTDQPEVVRAALGPDHAVQAKYLRFLLETNRLQPAAAIARDLSAWAAAADLDLLFAASDRLLDLATWNNLCARLIPCQPLAPERGISLTNPDFAYEPVLHGFDWRIPSDPEISAARAGPPPSLRISLSGRQPESCELLYQHVPLVRQRRYHFRFQIAGPQDGIYWRILDAEIPASRGAFDFESHDATLARLALIYERPAGKPRLEGAVTLRDLALEFAP